MEITLNVSEELATQLHPLQDQLPRILEFGLREWQATAQADFKEIASLRSARNDRYKITLNEYISTRRWLLRILFNS